MRYSNRSRYWGYASVIGLLSVALWVAQPAWAGIESYDPRLDPNYSGATPANPTPDWRAIEALAREFQERGATVASRSVIVGQYIQPQPWYYVGTDNSMMASQYGYVGPGYWTPPIGGVYPYWYGSGVYGWRDPYPRIPWWSLIPPRHHHRFPTHLGFHGRHGSMIRHRGW